LRDRLEDALRRIAKGTNLLKLVVGESSSSTALDVQVLMRPRNSTTQFVPVEWTVRPDFKSGSELRINLHNKSSVPLDVTVLYLDAAWGITPLYPQTPGRNNRINGGQSDQIGGGGLNGQLVINANPAGVEHLLLIAIPAKKQELLADYSFLSQPTLPVSKDVSRGKRDGFHDLLVQAGFTGGVTRGPPTWGSSEGMLANQLTFRTVK
jgi:hypothetical protein